MGVELDKKRPGHAVALFADYQFTAQNDEYLDLARYQSRSFCVPPAITVDANKRIRWHIEGGRGRDGSTLPYQKSAVRVPVGFRSWTPLRGDIAAK